MGKNNKETRDVLEEISLAMSIVEGDLKAIDWTVLDMDRDLAKEDKVEEFEVRRTTLYALVREGTARVKEAEERLDEIFSICGK